MSIYLRSAYKAPFVARATVVAAFWLIRSQFDSSHAGLENGFAIVTDICLIVLHEWLNRPLRTRDAERFGRRDSATAFLLVPQMGAVICLFRDLLVVFKLS